MLFCSPFFIFGFLPFFLLLFFFSHNKIRDYILLTGSILFYLWGEPLFCCIALISSFVDHFICKLIYKINIKNTKKRFYLSFGIIINLSLLVYYKYSTFILDNLIIFLPSLHYSSDFFKNILPIGISFITFEKITYLVDIYHGSGKPAASLLKYLNYIFLFPKLLAGPIVKYHEIEHQLHQRLILSTDIIVGFKRFIMGLIKKLLIADTCAEIVNQIFSLDANHLSCNHAWLGLFSFTLQIYFDFSAYSDMALGIARMLGFILNENFNMPYISTSFTEFWRRWHISLSTWIRDYLYIPLGGNRVGKKRRYLNLWICFLIAGLWHGANWTFVIWGLYNGIFLIIDKLFWLKVSNKIPKLVSVAVTFPLIGFGFVIFRSSSFQQIYYYLLALFSLNHPIFNYVEITSNAIVSLIFGAIISFIPLFPGYSNVTKGCLSSKFYLLINNLLLSVLGIFAFCKSVAINFNPFLYFKF
ncbi:MAG: MBOAT family O-acyltransferase [Candidatus Aquirickettsiella sp.]